MRNTRNGQRLRKSRASTPTQANVATGWFHRSITNARWAIATTMTAASHHHCGIFSGRPSLVTRRRL
ncbi:hypothetical protein [Glycomyces sp. NPDC048151]|uniref:hypothetical protein n=1 Tax=Glycomyces sp. NPDC048151 TaxID=3364002 RepID=UPI003712A3FE